jgi:hypothetical protein
LSLKGAVTATIAVLVSVMAYALLDDAFNGFPFSRSAPSWGAWLGGLLVFGLGGILAEGAFEWVFGPNEPWRRGPRRIVRVSAAAVIVAVVVAAVVLVNRHIK